MYDLGDISVIIPTYNRADDLKITLNSIVKFKNLKEVIIVDQSKDNKTKKLVANFKNKKLKYIFSSVPAITIARNLGFKTASKDSKIIVFIDDDVTLGKNYFEEILSIFNTYKDAKGVGGVEIPETKENISVFEIFARRLFFLSYPQKNQSNILSAYGNTYPSMVDKVINVQWIPGVNMAYKREVFSKQKFDENLLGYTVAEDIDFSYRLFKKYPRGLFLTPFVDFKHRGSRIERYPTEKMAYINQIDHFYFYFKNLDDSIFSKIKFSWTLIGIFLLRCAKLIKTRQRSDLDKLKFFIRSTLYCLNNLKIIKKGILRNFPVRN